jgi:hypothetical protein
MRFPQRLATPASLPGDTSPPAPPPPAAAPGGDAITSYLTDLHSDTREELNRADSKASLLLAAMGVIVGVIVGGITSSHWSPLSMGTGEQALWWAGVAAAAASMFMFAASVYPRISRRGPRASLPNYYGDVAGYADVEAFRRGISQAPDAAERLIHQTYVLAKIVRSKYVLLQRGLLSLLVAIVACTMSIALNLLLR